MRTEGAKERNEEEERELKEEEERRKVQVEGGQKGEGGREKVLRGVAMVTQGGQRYDENEEEWELAEVKEEGDRVEE